METDRKNKARGTSTKNVEIKQCFTNAVTEVPKN